MLLNKETKDIQSQLSRYCRDGELTPIEGAREDRLPTYRRLVFNVIRDTLSQAYPITYEILNKEEWGGLVYDFFLEHNCQNNEVWKMPYELVEYIEQTQYHLKLSKPYLLELVYFEWLEIEIHGQEDVEISEVYEFKGGLNSAIVLNPYLKIIQLQYPVHKLGYKELEENKGDYYVLIYRSIETDKVHFLELSSFSVHLIHTIESKNDIESFLDKIAKQSGLEIESLISAATSFLLQMNQKGVVIGIQ